MLLEANIEKSQIYSNRAVLKIFMTLLLKRAILSMRRFYFSSFRLDVFDYYSLIFICKSRKLKTAKKTFMFDQCEIDF